MKTFCIIPCGSKKVWDKNPNAGPTVAKEVYIGGFAKKCKEYAEKFYPLSWCILSAKYGFVFPHEIIPAPYNVSFNDKSTNPISVAELISQSKEKGLNDYDDVVVLAGRNYVSIATQVFGTKHIITPLVGCKGIGYMIGKLNELINRDECFPPSTQKNFLC